MPDLLVVSRDPDVLHDFEEAAKLVGFRVKACVDVSVAIEWTELKKFSAVVLDATIPFDAASEIGIGLWSLSALAPMYVYDPERQVPHGEGGIRLLGAEPISGPEALQTLTRLLGSLRHENLPQITDGFRVMVVEDLDAPRDIICAYVEGLGVAEVLGRPSAAAALVDLEANPALVSCVITDIRMPEISGAQLIEQVRMHERLKHLPIIVLTAYGTADALLDCLRAGASGFLIKPPKRAELVRELARAQRIFRRRLSPRLATPYEVENLRALLVERGMI